MFVHRISKGSRFNQIYIPQEMSKLFEVGDTVRVELVEKKAEIYFPGNVKLSKFKEKLIREIFAFLGEFKEIESVFFVGSFITQKIDYRDIDLLIVGKNKHEKLENEVYSNLIDKFNLKFHLIFISEESMKRLSEICPLTRSMLYSYVSSKKFAMPKNKLDKNHIKFLLMMPEDLLRINAGSRIFYDNIRRLITIERFLNKKELKPEEINKELKKSLGNSFELLRENEEINKEITRKIREIIRNKLNKIKRMLT